MNTKNILIGIAVLLVVIAGGAYLYSLNAKPADTTQQSTATTSPVGSMYEKDNLLLGLDGKSGSQHLIGFNGRAVYTYAKDTEGVSNCSGTCATNWPPYLVGDANALGNLQAGVNGKAGTITRADGGLQVTYNGKPLYFYASDTDTSGASGDGVGGVWSVAKPTAATPTPTQADTAALNQRIFDNGVYITPLSIVEDSRCPTDVQCIQAGTVKISVKLEDSTHTQTVTAVMGSPISFGNKHVTLMSVTPAKNSKTTIKPSDYRFTFSVAYGMGGDAP